MAFYRKDGLMSTTIDLSKSYVKYDSTEWVNDETLINEDRLNKIEYAIKQLQRAESLLEGTVSPDRLQVASHRTGDNSTAILKANLGTVQIYNGGSTTYSKLGQGEPTLQNGFAISPKALNDLYMNSAEPDKLDGTRVAKKAITAVNLEKNVKIRLSGDVSMGQAIIFNSGSDLELNYDVQVLGDQHTHGLGQLVNCNSNINRSGLVQTINDIAALKTAKEQWKVPTASLVNTEIENINKITEDLNKKNSDAFSIIESIKSLNAESLKNTNLILLSDKVTKLDNWKNTFLTGDFKTVSDSVLSQGNSIVALNNAMNDYYKQKNNIEKIENLVFSDAANTIFIQDNKNNIALVKEAINILCNYLKYSKDIWDEASKNLSLGVVTSENLE